MTKNDLLYILIIAIPVAIIALIKLVLFLLAFKKELQYLEAEIARNDGPDRDYWIKKKRRLWLSLLPFVRY